MLRIDGVCSHLGDQFSEFGRLNIAPIKMLQLAESMLHQLVFGENKLLTRIHCLLILNWRRLVGETGKLKGFESNFIVVSIRVRHTIVVEANYMSFLAR